MQCIYPYPHILAESPLWDHRENLLYWIDIEALELHCLNIATQAHRQWKLPSRPGCIAMHEEGGLLIALSQEIVHFLPVTGEMRVIQGTTLEGKVRFNDGKCDSEGRFWVGSMDLDEKEPIGALYCLDHHQALKMKDKHIIISNGLGWSPDQSVMYFTDSPRRTIYRYEFNSKTSELAHRKIFAKVSQEAGYPDGLCVDQEGYVWSAHFMGGKITRYAPDGSMDQVLQVPALCPTSCCFGGEKGNQLFVTTATRDLTVAQKEENPLNGGIFMVEMEKIRGSKEVPFSIKP